MNLKNLISIILALAILPGCQTASPDQDPDLGKTVTPPIFSAPTVSAAPTLPDSIGLYWGLGDQPVPDGLESRIAAIASERKLEFLRVESISTLPESVKYLVVVVGKEPTSAFSQLGEVPILLIGPAEIDSQNVVRLLPTLQDIRRLGFLSGYLAAAISDEWRVGLLVAQNEAPGFQEGFLNGVDYMCGLCQQAFPPFYTYPLVEAMVDGGQEIPGSVNQLLATGGINTLLLSPGLSVQETLSSGEVGEVSLLAALDYGEQPHSSLSGYSAFGPLPVNFEQIFSLWLAGEDVSDTVVEWELVVRSVDLGKVSEGRLTFVRQILPLLTSGAIEP